MIELVEAIDSRAVRNKNNVLALYDLMINQKRSEEATAKFVSPSYIQHNPLIPDGSVALGQFFAKVTRERARVRVVVHRIIAVGDYVWAHLNFLNLFNDDPDSNPRQSGKGGERCRPARSWSSLETGGLAHEAPRLPGQVIAGAAYDSLPRGR